MSFAGITAHHLANWYANNRFCGACGGRMTPKEEERALACPACATSVYPRISPAVIVGVVNGSRLLLTRYANRPYRNYALIAGFVEVGETLEDAAHREVFEETGVRVKNLSYYKSQPWGFSGSLLAGFFAELDGSPELNIDSNELEDAQWLGAEDIPLHDDGVSLTGEMMQVFRHRYLLA
jgi:NAD+ diphosphatase